MCQTRLRFSFLDVRQTRVGKELGKKLMWSLLNNKQHLHYFNHQRKHSPTLLLSFSSKYQALWTDMKIQLDKVFATISFLYNSFNCHLVWLLIYLKNQESIKVYRCLLLNYSQVDSEGNCCYCSRLRLTVKGRQNQQNKTLNIKYIYKRYIQ